MAHLATCAACQAEVDELSVAVQALPMSAPPMKPPPALKARIMAEVEREAALLASASEPRTRNRGQAPPWRFSLAMGAVAGLACVAAACWASAPARRMFGGGGPHGAEGVRPPRSGRRARNWKSTATRRVLVANGLPAPPEGQVYMVWLVGPDGKPKPTSALFKPRGDGSATASVTRGSSTPRPWWSTPRSRRT